MSDHTLDIELLKQLAELQKSMRSGDTSVTVQPKGLGVTNIIDVPGFDGDQIDAGLKSLLERGLVTSGVTSGSPMLGIQFGGLTATGRRLLGP